MDRDIGRNPLKSGQRFNLLIKIEIIIFLLASRNPLKSGQRFNATLTIISITLNIVVIPLNRVNVSTFKLTLVKGKNGVVIPLNRVNVSTPNGEIKVEWGKGRNPLKSGQRFNGA